MTAWTTTDLSDAHPDVPTARPELRHFGGIRRFCGPIETVRVFEDNVLVLGALETVPEGSVVVVDGGGSVRVALLGDRLAGIAMTRKLGGVVIDGCIRDSAEIGTMAVGVMARAAVPRRSNKLGEGERGVDITIAGIEFRPGGWVYADDDGILVTTPDTARIHE